MSDQASPEVRPIRRWGPQWRPVLALVAVYVAIRLLHLWLLDQGLHVIEISDDPHAVTDNPSLYEQLGAWDGQWYVRIADDGYPDHLTMESVREDSTAGLAFPPLYPMLIRLVSLLGVPPLGAGIAVASLAGLVAVVGVYAVARDLISPRAAWITAVLWAAGPMTIVLTMAYTEGLFVALAAWAIWLARRGWWLTAGLLGLLAGLTRSNGFAVGAAIAVAAALAVWADRKARVSADAEDPAPGETETSEPEPAQENGFAPTAGRWRPIAGAVLALLGVPLWWAYVAIVGGRADAWFAAQDFFWGSHFDFGESVLTNGWRMLTFDGRFDPMTRVVYTLSFFLMMLAVVLLVVLLLKVWRFRGSELARTWWPVAAYAAVLVVLAAGSAGFPHSKPRFLVPMFPLLLIPATWVSRWSRTAQVMVIVGIALATGWFGAYMLDVWTHAI